MSELVKISATAPTPLMYKTVAPQFEALRLKVKEETGVDFMSKCGDVFRPAGFATSKSGVAFRSNHKTGRAFDYDQTSASILVQLEPKANQTFFRTFLICKQQDGTQGVRMSVRDYRGMVKNCFVVDFTALAELYGFRRIPARSNWQKTYNNREFWHYQSMVEGGQLLTWDEAMLMLQNKTRPTQDKVYGRNDHGPEIGTIQTALWNKGLLPKAEIDDWFGDKTTAAVKEFQKQHGLDSDGLVGPATRKILFQ